MIYDTIISAEVIIKFKINNICSQADLDDSYKGDIDKCVRELIEYEGLFGVAEDDFEILTITKKEVK
jgi:hypothetical protein